MSTTAAKIRAQLLTDDPGLVNDDRALNAATILISALHVGPSQRALEKFTGLPRRVVRETCQAARSNGIFGKDGKVHADWLGKDGGIAFWLDVNVALGFMRRASGKPKKTPSKKVAFLKEAQSYA